MAHNVGRFNISQEYRLLPLEEKFTKITRETAISYLDDVNYFILQMKQEINNTMPNTRIMISSS